MSGNRPTLAELRAKAQKGHYRTIGNVWARFVMRPTALFGSWLAIRLGLSANQVTALALGVNLLAAAGVGSGLRPAFVAGVLLLHLGCWLDHVDGQVARWRESSSLSGVYFDYALHFVTNLALGFALGFGLMLRQGAVSWVAAGFAISVGWTMLGLHNDCRYKAFFQRLKSTEAVFRVRGGAGGKPAPAAGWPRIGWGVWTWPASKFCEAHVVLWSLSLLAIVSFVNEWWWQGGWMAYVAAMAVIAPVMATGRMARTILSRQVDEEFSRWFVPVQED
jgi:phosphatidylglycerophosphate synthase